MPPALDISIPTTSTSTPSDTSSKPYTLYHVTLQLPIRAHTLQKRYTDFANLHAALEAQTGAAPPVALPAKSWLRRTVNNAALAEERRKGLQAYLKGIIEAEDARWRSSAAWRGFLNLPAGGSTLGANGVLSTTSAAKRPGSGGGGAGGGAADPNEWLDVHRDLKTQIQSARQLLKQREAATSALQQHSLGADAKASLVRAAAAIAQLEDGLRGLGEGKKLGEGEMRRRRDMVGAAKKEVEGLEGVLRSMASKSASSGGRAADGGGGAAAATEGDREGLWKGTANAKPGGRVLGGPLRETERTREQDNTGVLQVQKQIMQEQEEDVMELGKTVSRLKDMGIMMEEELTIQNQMLGITEGDVDRLQGKINVAKGRIKKIS